ncbi:hypothetical protein [Pseudactinotalea sp. Z1748]|uniref:hypothetical protein n=1 Tax=Pseudactinotalea sp. Z1748 TaxID=3413027 RepID=UPI003C7A9128
MNTEPDDPAELSLTDRWQRFWYLQTVGLWLDPIPRRRRKGVLRELKANLGVAAGRDGMSAAISDHGRPRALARQYLDAEPHGRPTWHHGAAAVSVALVAWFFACATYVFGSLNTLLGAGLAEPVRISFLGVQITTEAHDAYLGATFTGVSWGSLIAFALIFVLAARLWRLLPRHQHRRTTAPVAR